MRIHYLWLLWILLYACSSYKKSAKLQKALQNVELLQKLAFYYEQIGTKLEVTQWKKYHFLRQDKLGICFSDTLTYEQTPVEVCFLSQDQNIIAVYSIWYFKAYEPALHTYKALRDFLWKRFRQAPRGSFGNYYWQRSEERIGINLRLAKETPYIYLSFYGL